MGETTRPEVLGLAGSPRRGGNSETLLDRALEGAREAGANAAKLVINEMKFVPCQNCGACNQSGRCRFRDEMYTIYDALDRADRIILASPIYFTNVSAQTKMMVDRCQPYWVRKYLLKQPPAKPGRTGFFLCVGGFKKGQKFFEMAEFLVKVWMINLDVKLTGSLCYPGVDHFGDVQRHPAALTEAFAAGRGLVTPGSQEAR